MPTGVINTYATLQTAIADYLLRDDLTVQIPMFIQLANTRIGQKVQPPAQRATITVSAEQTSLPSQFGAIRTARLVTGTPQNDYPLEVVTAELLATRKADLNGTAGRPLYMCLEGATSVVVAPVPDASYNVEIWGIPWVPFYNSLGSPSTGVPADATIAAFPLLYLYGALREAAIFTDNAVGAQGYSALFEEQLTDFRIFIDRAQFPSLAPMDLPVTF
jgi:hypothetical protein